MAPRMALSSWPEDGEPRVAATPKASSQPRQASTAAPLATMSAPSTLARLPQLGGFEDANRLIFRDWTLKGRHYTALDGRPCSVPSGGDPRRRLLRQGHAELVQQQLVLLVRPGVTRQDELPAVGSR